MNLWDRGNSSDYELEGPISSSDGHAKTIQRVKELLTRRNLSDAVDLLERTPFLLYDAHNHFGDEFGVLLFEVPLARYEELRLFRTDAYSRRLLAAIAEVFGELGIYIRIIAAEIADDLGLVQSPEPLVTMEVVDRALRDAEVLLAQAGPVSAVDRVHTALHGFLLDQCRRAGITCDVADPSSARLFGLIRAHHPALAQTGPLADQMTTLLRSLGATIGVLEPLRNRGSVAHPNEALLDQAEAMLFINTARTLLHYLAAKLPG
jgi:hypothetical protein